MKVKLLLLLICTFLVDTFIVDSYSQYIRKSVIGSGGTRITNGQMVINGTLGQTFVGFMKDDTLSHGAGFWYDAIFLPKPELHIYFPKIIANTGDVIEVPLLVKNKIIPFLNKKKFKITMSFNSTVLFPKTPTPPCSITSGYDCSITDSNRLSDTSLILMKFHFIVKLGNAESTVLSIDSFSVEGLDDITIEKENGEVLVADVCKEGGEIRLIQKGIDAGIISISPNPATDNLFMKFSILEKGFSKIIMLDNLGNEVANLNFDVIEPGIYSQNIDVSSLNNGSYILVMYTPSQTFSRKIIISK